MTWTTALFALFLALAAPAAAAQQQSVARVTFGPSGVLFAADWKAGRIFAYRLPAPAAIARRPFNLTDLQTPLQRVAGSPRFTVRDIAMRPGTAEAYLALEAGPRGRPVIARVTPDGGVVALDLAKLAASSVALHKPGGSLVFWDHIPAAAFTVTDMKWHAGRLYVAGLANQSFSSTLRVLSYPFARQSIASVEMYHTVHNQIETRAPIRALTFATIDGVDTLLAGYLCSPLVALPVAEIVDGAHVRAKTLAELGVAGIPTSMIVYDQPDPATGKTAPFLLVNERFRPSVTIPLGGIAKANAGPGITAPPDMMAPAGANVGAIAEDFDGVLGIDNQNAGSFVAFRRDLATGAPQVVSYDKHASFRLSDADLSEYNFPGYTYSGDYQLKMILPMQNLLKREEGYPDLVIPAKP